MFSSQSSLLNCKDFPRLSCNKSKIKIDFPLLFSCYQLEYRFVLQELGSIFAKFFYQSVRQGVWCGETSSTNKAKPYQTLVKPSHSAIRLVKSLVKEPKHLTVAWYYQHHHHHQHNHQHHHHHLRFHPMWKHCDKLATQVTTGIWGRSWKTPSVSTKNISNPNKF